jgi:hypothetical protein
MARMMAAPILGRRLYFSGKFIDINRLQGSSRPPTAGLGAQLQSCRQDRR